MEEPRSESPERSDGPDPSSRSRPLRRSWWGKLKRIVVVGLVILRKEWELLVDPDASWFRGIRTRDRAPVALPERPVRQRFPEHLLMSSNVRELQRAAREMVAEENWYTALELYTEALRRHERSPDQEVDVTLYHRIADLHRRLAVEWYVEAADHYTERSLRHGAIALCERALQLDPDQEEARHNLTWLLDRTARPPAPAESARAEPSTPAPEPEEAAPPEESAPPPTEDVSQAPEAEPSPAAEAPPTPELEPSPAAPDGLGEVFEVEPLPGTARRRARPEPAPHREPPPRREVRSEETRDETRGVEAPAGEEDRRPEGDERPEPVADPAPPPRPVADPSVARPEGGAEPLPDRIVLPPPDEEYEQLRRRVRRIVVGAGATLAALIVIALVAL